MSELLQRLSEAIPAAELVIDPDVLASISQDQAALSPAGRAAVGVRARSVDSVRAALAVASATRTPVVTRGAGTGLSGGANAVDGCILLSVGGMNQILDLDPQAMIARVQAGVLNGALDEAARSHGLMYAPDPASRDISTIGGNVATNAGGACCLKYGVTGDHVASIRALLADGSPVQTGALSRKDVAGLDLKRLLIGSEGTLAVITEVTVRLLPLQPVGGTTIAFFDSLAAAGEAIVALSRRGGLSRLEVMDRATVQAVEDMLHMELDTDAAATLIVQADGADAAAQVAAAEALCERLGAGFVATTTDEDEGQMFMQARSAALPALERKGQCLLDDVAVPVAQVPALLKVCQDAAARSGATVATFGHAGDGNLHPTIVFDATDPDSTARAQIAFDLILRGALALGGSITGEHGVGSLKRGYLEAMVGKRELELMRGIKRVFDPLGILNPGKWI